MAQAERFEALADYVRVLDALDAVFARDQVLLEYYEDIHADREAALKRICKFLNVGFEPGCLGEIEQRYNPSQPAHMPVELQKKLRIKYRAMVREVEDRVGRVPSGWRRDFET